jgi:hypothetical protein
MGRGEGGGRGNLEVDILLYSAIENDCEMWTNIAKYHLPNDPSVNPKSKMKLTFCCIPIIFTRLSV